MRNVGFFRATVVLAAKDLRLEWRTMETLTSSLIFSMIVLVIFNFAFGLGSAQELGVHRLVPGVIWTTLAFASMVGMIRSSQIESQRETLTALFMAPVDRGALFAGKLVANVVKLTVLQFVLIPLAALFFNFDLLSNMLPLAAVMVLHGLGLTELGTLFAAITTRVGRGEALLATLLLPAASPLLVSAVKCTAAVLEGKPFADVSHWLLTAAGFDVLYMLVGLMTFEFVLEE